MVVNAGFLCDAAAEHAHRRHRLSFAVLRLGTSGTAFACVFSLPIAARTPLTTPPFACASPRKPPAWSLRCKYRLSSSMMALITSDLAAAAAGDALRHRGGYDFLGGNGHTAFAPRSHRLCFMCSHRLCPAFPPPLLHVFPPPLPRVPTAFASCVPNAFKAVPLLKDTALPCGCLHARTLPLPRVSTAKALLSAAHDSAFAPCVPTVPRG